MDQTIIILVLILIAILVSFYSTYLSMNNARKIRRLQNDIRDTLGNINCSLNQQPVPHPEPIKKKESRTNLQDLDQFPSLEEIENYDKIHEVQPLDEDLKKELDQILDDQVIEPKEEEGKEVLTTQDLVPTDDILETLEDNKPSELIEEPMVGEVNKVEEVTLKAEEVPEAEVTPEAEPVEEILVNNNLEELLTSENLEVEELAPALEEELQVNSADTRQMLDNLPQKVEDIELDSVISNMEDLKNGLADSLPRLEELNQENMLKMTDKNLKLICKREGIKVRGSKIDRINRILETQEFKVKLN